MAEEFAEADDGWHGGAACRVYSRPGAAHLIRCKDQILAEILSEIHSHLT